MSGRVLVCKCCGQPLQVVCPTHGTSTVAASWPDTVHHLGARELRRGTVRERIVLALPPQGSPGADVPHIASVVGVTVPHVRAELHELLTRGLIERVARGRYVQAGRAA